MEKDALSILKEDHDMVKESFKLFEGLDETEFEEKKRISDEICTALTMHATMEEELFYPTVRAEVGEAEDLLNEAFIEHSTVKDLIAQIEAMSPEDELFDSTVHVLREQVEHHVQEEEGELFPLVRKSKLDLQAMGKEMRDMKEEWEMDEA